MHFTIITPSFNQLDYLRRCIASVRDQVSDGVKNYDLSFKQEGTLCADLKPNHLIPKTEPEGSIIKPNHLKLNTAGERLREPITVHHHVQDGASADATVDWLRQYDAAVRGRRSDDRGQRPVSNYQLTFASEADNGMYDALNKGIEYALGGTRHQAPGISDPNNDQPSTINTSNQVVAWLNCDEQYLPGTLQAVAEYFTNHPDVDVLCGHALVVDEAGGLTGFWKSMPLRRRYVQSGYLYNLSCAIFFRAGVFKQGLRFNTDYKALGDQDFMIRLLDRGIKTAVLNTFLSAYTFMPGNLSEQRFARKEREGLLDRFWGGSRWLRLFWRTAQRAERFLRGCRYQRFPLEYAIYGSKSAKRNVFKSHRVSVCWPGERK